MSNPADTVPIKLPSFAARYAKAIIAALAAGVTTLAPYIGSHITRAEWATAILAVLVTPALVALVPNAPSRTVLTELQDIISSIHLKMNRIVPLDTVVHVVNKSVLTTPSSIGAAAAILPPVDIPPSVV